MHQQHNNQLSHHQLWAGEAEPEPDNKENEVEADSTNNLQKIKPSEAEFKNMEQESARSRLDEERMDLKNHLDTQVAELKLKEKAGKDLRVSEAEDVRTRSIARDLEDIHKAEEKRRLARECDLYNQEAARLKSAQKAREVAKDRKFDLDLIAAMEKSDLEDADKRKKMKEAQYEELHLLQMQANDDIMRRNEHKINKSQYDNRVIEIHDLNKKRQMDRLAGTVEMESEQLEEYRSELDGLHKEEERVVEEMAAIEKRREDRNRDFY